MNLLDQLKSKLDSCFDDSEKIEILYEIEELLLKEQTISQLEKYQRLIVSISEKGSDKDRIISSKFKLASTLNRLNRLDHSIEIVDQLNGSDLSKEYRIKTTLLKATILLKKGENNRSTILIDEAISLCEGDKLHKLELAKSYLLLGVINRNLFNYLDAYQHFLHSHYLYSICNENQEIANLSVWIGTVLSDMGDLENSITYYFKALEISKRYNFNDSLGNIYNSLGLNYLHLKEYSEAEKYLELGLDYYKRFKLDTKIADSLSNLGSVYKYRGDNERANSYFLRSIAIRGDIDIQMNRSTYAKLAELHFDIGQLDQSKIYLDTLNDIDRKINIKGFLPLGKIVEWKIAYLENDNQKFEDLEEVLKSNLEKFPKEMLDNYLNFKKDLLIKEGRLEEFPELYDTIFHHYRKIDDRMRRVLKQFIKIKNDLMVKMDSLYREKEEKDRLASLNRELKGAQESIIKLEKHNTVLAMGVTINHEIKQPLATINGYLGLLEKDTTLSPKQREIVEKLKKNQKRIASLLDKYRDQTDFKEMEYIKGINMISFEEE